MTNLLPTISAGSVGLISFQPLPDVQPFTIRDAASYEEILSTIRVWIRDTLVPYLSTDSVQATFQSNIDTMIDTVNAALTTQATQVTAALNQAVTELANGDVPITDPAILVVLNTITSETNAALNARYATGISAPAPIGGGADDTAALMAVIGPAHTFGAKVQLQRGTYTCNLDLAAQFPQVTIVGQGTRATILQAFDKTKPVVIYRGGSGALNGGGLHDLALTSAAGAVYEGIALAYSGCGGVKSKNIRIYGSFAEGVRFWNQNGNDFTEFCTFEGDIDDCRNPVVYQSDNGVESFHGSGIEGNTTINIPNDNVTPVVDIRGVSLPYNAPMSFTVWFHTASAYLFNYAKPTVGRHCSFYGRIGVEGAPSAANLAMGVAAVSNNYILFAGTFTWLGTGTVVLGAIRQCRKIGYNGATVWGDREPFTNLATLKSGATTVATDFTGGSLSIVAVSISGANYEYHTLLAVEKDPTNGANGYVVEFGKTQGFDTAGKGAPVFSYSNGLVITNNNYDTTFSAVVTVNHMGGGSAFKQLPQNVFS